MNARCRNIDDSCINLQPAEQCVYYTYDVRVEAVSVSEQCAMYSYGEKSDQYEQPGHGLREYKCKINTFWKQLHFLFESPNALFLNLVTLYIR
jgi:hypothetical protein